MMGAAPAEPRAQSDEMQHRVTLSQPFYLGTTEVTRGQWESVMGTTPWNGADDEKKNPNVPATEVSWLDAVEFCEKLSATEGKTYRLPTEAEWEYACRAGTTTAHSFGSSFFSDYGWYKGTIRGMGAQNVGLKQPNSYGLFDVHGNVAEYCS